MARREDREDDGGLAKDQGGVAEGILEGIIRINWTVGTLVKVCCSGYSLILLNYYEIYLR